VATNDQASLYSWYRTAVPEKRSIMIRLLIVLTVMSMAVCWWIAVSRGADWRFWLLMGLLFGPFAIPFACFAKTR